jgi:hypothetical protein
MKALRLLSPIFVMLLAACSTTVNTTQSLAPSIVGTMKFGQVRVTSRVLGVSSPTMEDLQTAVQSRLNAMPQGSMPVTVDLDITAFDIVSGEMRAFIGVFGGDNRMDVAVKVTDAAGKTVTQFQISRSANPGGYGMFYDQKQATIEVVANAIADTLAGRVAK